MSIIYYNNTFDLHLRNPQISNYFKDEHKITNYTAWDYIIQTNDSIFFNDGSYTYFKILTLKQPQKQFSSFDEIRNQIKSNKKCSLLNKIMNNFDWKLNQKIY